MICCNLTHNNNDNTNIYCNKKRKMNEDTINYKELYEQEQRKVKELKSEIIIIKYECLRLLTEHTQIQSSIMILQVLLYLFLLTFIIIIIITIIILILIDIVLNRMAFKL